MAAGVALNVTVGALNHAQSVFIHYCVAIGFFKVACI
jgi:hypothetical protein